MQLDTWKEYIDKNFINDKMNVLYGLVYEHKITYEEYVELLKYLQGK